MPVLVQKTTPSGKKNGYVVIHNAVPPENAEACAQAVWDFLEMDPDDPEKWYPDPPRRSIMVEIYQHQALGQPPVTPRPSSFC